MLWSFDAQPPFPSLGLVLCTTIFVFSNFQVAYCDVIHVKGAGATFPKAVYRQAISVYQTSRPKLLMDYDAVGSGNGQKRIKAFYDNKLPLSDQVIFAGSDSELSDQDYIDYPGIQMMPSLAG